jgi:hypothetical protein
MNFKNFLPAALAGLIGVSVPACKPLVEKKKAEVEHILNSVQPTEDIVSSWHMPDSLLLHNDSRMDLFPLRNFMIISLLRNRELLLMKIQNSRQNLQDIIEVLLWVLRS